MFAFLPRKHREQVRRMLQNRMNRNYFKQFRYGKRTDPRANFCEVVWVIPYDRDTGQPDFDRVRPLLTKDSSSEGLSLLDTSPFTADEVLIGLPGSDDMGPSFVHCTHTHSSPMGYGFYQLGLHPEKLVTLGPAEQARLQRQLAKFENAPAKKAEAACV